MKPLLTLLSLSCPAILLSASPPEKDDLQNVSQAAIQSAFQILRSDYIRSTEIDFDELNRAAMQGLLQRLDLGAELLTKVEAQRPPMKSGVLAETLTPDIAFLRPLAFVESEPAILATKLREFREAGISQLILDLRSAAAPGEFLIAAAMLECFIPEGDVMFKLKQVGREDAQLFISHQPSLWPHPLVILIDEETSNLGETIAAVLHQRKQAILVGAPTRGASVQYESLPLDDQWILRFARAEMLLPDDSSLFKKGLQPEHPIPLPSRIKRQLFDPSHLPATAKASAFDQAKPRYNEAALVAGKHPELDDYIRRSAGQTADADKDAPRDLPLQRAVDMLIMRTHLKSADLDWTTSARDARPTIKKAQRAP
jgi:Peptidase family S41